jgi:hypothetical protein
MRTARLSNPLPLLLLALLLISAVWGLRSVSAKLPPPSPATAGSAFAAATTDGCLPSHDGYLRARLRSGSLEKGDVDIDWNDADMQCEGGLRPDAQGMRMMFAGRKPGDQHRLRLVFGLAAQPDVHEAHNVPTNITLIDEDDQRLFSTAGDGKCTIDALTLQPTLASADEHWHRFTARGFCTGPASTLSGNDTLLVDRFDFAGMVRDD